MMAPSGLKKQALDTSCILILVRGFVLLVTQIPMVVLAQFSGAEEIEGDNAAESANVAPDEEWQGPTLRARGRLYGSFESIDPPDGTPNDSRLNDAYLRKADLTVRGSLLRDTGYYVKIELMDAELDIRDAYFDYDAGFAVIKAGYMDPIDEIMIPAYREFMEGAAMEGLLPGNQLGVGFLHERENWTFFAGAFKHTIDKRHLEKAGTMYSTRFTVAPPVPDGYLLHIGGYASWRKADDEEGLYRYSARSLLRTGERYVDTGAVADEEMLFGMELAGSIGSTSFESQCAVVRASIPSNRGSNLYLNGCYLSGIWTLTGEIRNYGGGGFSLLEVDRSVFEGGPGAWQIGLRYDTIDLSDGVIQGGGQNNWTFALNWYLNDQFWISGNYSRTKFEDNAQHGEVTDGLGARVQYLVEW